MRSNLHSLETWKNARKSGHEGTNSLMNARKSEDERTKSVIITFCLGRSGHTDFPSGTLNWAAVNFWRGEKAFRYNRSI